MLNEYVTADPLSEYSSMSIFSRAFGASTTANTLTYDDDIDFMHTHLKSMELQSPQKLFEEAKTIVDRGMEFSTMNNLSSTYSQKVKEDRNERRPGLGMKRARFSFNPDLGKSTVNLETNFDIDQLKDPDEYFMAYEKLENARKELRRLGVDVTENNIDSNRRQKSSKQRRPGMLRKPVSYTHRYLPMASDLEETYLHTTGSLNNKSESENFVQSASNNEIMSADLLTNDVKNESGDILDELLSSNIEELDEDGAISFLQERLNLKPINIEKLQIPDIPKSSFGSKMLKLETDLSGAKNVIRTNSNKISREVPDAKTPMSPSASPSQVKSPSEILHGLKDHVNVMQSNAKSGHTETSFPKVAMRSVNKTGHRDAGKDSLDYRSPDTRVSEKFMRSLASPLLRKSPLAALQSLKKNLVRTDMKNFSFSALDPDSSPEKNSDMVVKGNDETVHLGAELNIKDNGLSGSQTTHPSRHLFSTPSPPRQIPMASVDPLRPEMKIIPFPLLSSNNFRDRNTCNALTTSDGTEQPATGTGLLGSGDSDMDNEEHDALKVHDVMKPKEPDSVFSSDGDIFKSNSTNLEADLGEQLDDHAPSTDSFTSEKDIIGNGNSGSVMHSDALNEMGHSLNRKGGMNVSGKGVNMEENREFDTSVEGAGLPLKNDTVKVEAGGEPCSSCDLISEDQAPEINAANNKRNQKKSYKGKKRNESLRRDSLADAGTTWEAGVRRGTRIRMRPLEYWKGERFLYGRVHESLVTVIGVKYMSPSTKGEAKPMKVKSYVDDNFKELVEQAALH